MSSTALVIVYRHFSPQFFPAAEAGPATIFLNRALTWRDAIRCADGLRYGKIYPTIGSSGIPGFGLCPAVAILSDSDYSTKGPHYKDLDDPIPWFVSRPGISLPVNKLAQFDAIVTFRPRSIFPGQTIAKVAERLISLIHGTGASYYFDDLESMATNSR